MSSTCNKWLEQCLACGKCLTNVIYYFNIVVVFLICCLFLTSDFSTTSILLIPFLPRILQGSFVVLQPVYPTCFSVKS